MNTPRLVSSSSLSMLSIYHSDLLFLEALAFLTKKSMSASLSFSGPWHSFLPSSHCGCLWYGRVSDRNCHVYFSGTDFFLSQHKCVSYAQLGHQASYSHLFHGYWSHIKVSRRIYRCSYYFFLCYIPHCGECLMSDQYRYLIYYWSLQYLSSRYFFLFITSWIPIFSQKLMNSFLVDRMWLKSCSINLSLHILGRVSSSDQSIRWSWSGSMISYDMVPSGCFFAYLGV